MTQVQKATIYQVTIEYLRGRPLFHKSFIWSILKLNIQNIQWIEIQLLEDPAVHSIPPLGVI